MDLVRQQYLNVEYLMLNIDYLRQLQFMSKHL